MWKVIFWTAITWTGISIVWLARLLGKVLIATAICMYIVVNAIFKIGSKI